MAFQGLFGGGDEKGGGEEPAAEVGKEAAAGTLLKKSFGAPFEVF